MHGTPPFETPRDPEIEGRFHAVFPVLTMLLQREQRLTYGILRQIFSCDTPLLDALRDELRFKHLARDENGVLEHAKAQGQEFTPEAIAHVSPLAYRHLIVNGTYDFSPPQTQYIGERLCV